MPCGTAHAYECREAGEEGKRREEKKKTMLTNTQHRRWLATLDPPKMKASMVSQILEQEMQMGSQRTTGTHPVRRATVCTDPRQAFQHSARIPLSVTDNGHSTSKTGDHKTSCTTLNNFTLPTHFSLALALLQHLVNIEPSTLAGLARRVWTPIRTWTGFSSAHTLSLAFSRNWATCKIKR